jgi:hypothetical protein
MMKKNNDMFLGCGTLIFIFLIIICLLGSCVYTEGNYRKVTVTVTDKGIKNYKGGSKYLIYTKDENNKIATYRIEDSLVQGKFNSSDIYGSIEVGKKYTFEIAGERNEFLSMYPNIVKVVE